MNRALRLATLSLAACASQTAVTGSQPGLVTADRRAPDVAPVGAILVMGEARARIDAIERARTPVGDVALLSVSLIGSDGLERPLCIADGDGRRLALAIPDDRGGVRLTCTSGAIGKCVLWGYPPWSIGQHAPMASLHAACVRMVRADYGGDGSSATVEGTRIGFCDRFGVHPCRAAGGELEAAWSPDGAECVARPRVAELASLAALAARYPHLRDRLGPSACDRRHPAALLFSFRVRPRHEGR